MDCSAWGPPPGQSNRPASVRTAVRNMARIRLLLRATYVVSVSNAIRCENTGPRHLLANRGAARYQRPDVRTTPRDIAYAHPQAPAARRRRHRPRSHGRGEEA